MSAVPVESEGSAVSETATVTTRDTDNYSDLVEVTVYWTWEAFVAFPAGCLPLP